MTGPARARRRRLAALLPVLALAFTACLADRPDTVFGAHSEVGRSIDHLTMRLLYLAAIVFVLVEGLLLYVIIRFRARPGAAAPRQTHGNTTLEVTWTLIPAVILAFIAVPTVRTIFQTQARAESTALQVEVIGHQWWWEFRYPQYGVTTANELYLPVGRKANFSLQSRDVLHSFWIPNLAGGKRDLITNHTNYIWFTPDSAGVYNGFCAEYCGASHANMHFRVFTVPPAQFEQWVAHEKGGPAFAIAPAAAGAAPNASAAPQVTAADTASPTGAWPKDQIPKFAYPETPIPPGLELSVQQGDPARGAQLFRTGLCIGCHAVQGVSAGVLGPNLTHVGSRTTIAGSFYPNDFKHLSLWIKDAPLMKPGSLMPALGKSQANPAGYTDQQAADLAAYLLSLK